MTRSLSVASVLLAVCGSILVSTWAGPASAQTSVATPLPATPFFPAASDTLSDSGPISGFRLSSPLRLSLEGSVVPLAGGFANCEALEDRVGNSVGGIPVQHYHQLRLSPRLVLSAFTQLGCPIDAGIGLALTYTVPLRESMWLAFGAGAYAAPGQLPLFGGLQSAIAQGVQGGNSPTRAAVRADLVWKTPKGQPLSLGIETMGMRGGPRVLVGGGF